MSGVVAKFYVKSVARHAKGGAVELQAVCRGEENKSWSEYTPSGQITMSILNDAALQWFGEILSVVGQGKQPEVLVHFSDASGSDAPIA